MKVFERTLMIVTPRRLTNQKAFCLSSLLLAPTTDRVQSIIPQVQLFYIL
jgi:hypothetical protein